VHVAMRYGLGKSPRAAISEGLERKPRAILRSELTHALARRCRWQGRGGRLSNLGGALGVDGLVNALGTALAGLVAAQAVAAGARQNPKDDDRAEDGEEGHGHSGTGGRCHLLTEHVGTETRPPLRNERA